MLEVKTNTIQLRMDDNNLKFSFGKGDTEWNWTSEYRPKMECKEGTVYFDEALEIHHELVQNGIGKGIRSSFAGFEIEGKKVPYAFETYAWIEECTEDIFFEWIPICEEGLAVEKLFWPGELELEEKRKDWYTLLNMQQGVMIPNDWETELKDIPFDGFNIDHLIICPNGVFVIETKGRSKPINNGEKQFKVRVENDALHFPNHVEKAPLEQVRRNVTTVRNWLNSATGTEVPVGGVLVLPGWFVDLRQKITFPYIVSAAALPKQLPQFKAGSLELAQIQAIAHQVEQKVRDVAKAG